MARTKKLEHDEPLNFARAVLDHIIAKHDPEVAIEQGKNPHAVALGKRGGAKGGYARARNLSGDKRKLIAKQAADARWASEGKPSTQHRSKK
jgi:hypothetical protein